MIGAVAPASAAFGAATVGRAGLALALPEKAPCGIEVAVVGVDEAEGVDDPTVVVDPPSLVRAAPGGDPPNDVAAAAAACPALALGGAVDRSFCRAPRSGSVVDSEAERT